VLGLFLVLVVVPVVEIALLVELGRRLGTTATVALILLTGLLGAWLTRRQGLGVLRQVRSEMAAGRLPASQIVDGVLILLAGVLLLTPGVLTDALGFFCLLPIGRRTVKTGLRRWFERALASGRVRVSVGSPYGPARVDTLRDVTPPRPRSPAEVNALGGAPEPPENGRLR
jgi:UPF0716 protein FxsA